jgi:cyclohexadienyl dehydratase
MQPGPRSARRRVRAFARARLWALAAGLLVACPAPSPGPAPAPAPKPRAVLRVGTSGDYPPFSEVAPLAGGYRGFDVDVAERFARDAGLAIRWVPFRWPDLARGLAAGDFDVAMSGVTWSPDRAVTGFMTRAVAVGGPCVVGTSAALEAPVGPGLRVGVNHGGALERFARDRYRGAQIVAVDRNAALPGLLTGEVVDLIVTDSFELPHLGLGRFGSRCESPRERTVYWVAPPLARVLGPQLDAWLGAHADGLAALRERWLGRGTPRSEVDDLLDLLARRLAYMPVVAAWKRARGRDVEDPGREAEVLDAARAAARQESLSPEPVARLFAIQIALAKAVQAAAPAPAPDAAVLDLATQIRPALGDLDGRIVATAARVVPLDPARLDASDWTLLAAWVDTAGRARLRAALLALRPAGPM